MARNYSCELYHYGVIGMKWGVHKARGYAADKNNYVRRQQNKVAKARLKNGEITKEEYKKTVAKNYKAMVRKNQKVIKDTKNLTPEKGKKVSSIYNKYKNQAIKTIPHYKLKKGAKTAGSLLLDVGSTAVSAYATGGTSLITKAGIKLLAKKLATKEAVNVAKNVAIGAGKQEIENVVYDKKQKEDKKR